MAHCLLGVNRLKEPSFAEFCHSESWQGAHVQVGSRARVLPHSFLTTLQCQANAKMDRPVGTQKSIQITNGWTEVWARDAQTLPALCSICCLDTSSQAPVVSSPHTPFSSLITSTCSIVLASSDCPPLFCFLYLLPHHVHSRPHEYVIEGICKNHIFIRVDYTQTWRYLSVSVQTASHIFSPHTY